MDILLNGGGADETLEDVESQLMQSVDGLNTFNDALESFNQNNHDQVRS